MLNFEELAFHLLSQSLPDYTVVPELDVDEITNLPIVMYTVIPGGAVDGSVSPPTAWNVSLNVTVLAEGIDGAAAVSRDVYDAVWSWDNAWGGTNLVEGTGHVAEIFDQSPFTRVISADVAGRNITHYAGAVGMQMHRA